MSSPIESKIHLTNSLLEVLITIVLLVSWLEPFEDMGTLPSYEILDFFGGAARVAKAAREVGLDAGSFDISYHSDSSVFDVNSAPGFTSLWCM